MLYKTIVLELLQEETTLYEQLRTSNRLLPTLDAYAQDLKAGHEAWKARLGRADPRRSPIQVAAEAMERAIADLQARLPSASSRDEAEPTPADATSASGRRPTPAS